MFDDKFFDDGLDGQAQKVMEKVASGEGLAPEQMMILMLKAQTNHFAHLEVDLRNDMKMLREDMDKRFEQVNQRFEQSNTFMGWMIALFGGMFATTIIFALWDRRTMIRPFESKVKEIEVQIDLLKSDSTNKSILSSLRELAKTDSKLAEILKMHNLL